MTTPHASAGDAPLHYNIADPAAQELQFLVPSGFGMTYKDLMTFTWFGPTDMRSLDFCRDAVAHIRKRWPSFSVLILVAPGSNAPSREQRAQFGAIWQELPPRAFATVLEIEGFAATLIKTVMTAISTLSRNSETFRTFSNMRDGASWLGTRSAIPPGRLLAFAASLPRRATDPIPPIPAP
jgi:hypothetical protein